MNSPENMSQLWNAHLVKLNLVSKKMSISDISLGAKGTNALWINEALAALNYLPVQFAPSPYGEEQSGNTQKVDDNSTVKDVSFSTSTDKTDVLKQVPLTTTLSAQLMAENLQPLLGKWVWKANYPASLVSLWNPNVATVITQGAIMSFERQHGLAVDGIAGPQVRKTLATALYNNQVDKYPYIYVDVIKSGTEHLDLWQNGKKTMTTLANTGISESQTPNGTWPIYSRFTSQTMKGKLPGGGTYNDPGVPFVNYFYKGCAIHGFARASYGSPQSLGCVELPISSAKQLYTMLHFGSLVTVQA